MSFVNIAKKVDLALVRNQGFIVQCRSVLLALLKQDKACGSLTAISPLKLLSFSHTSGSTEQSKNL